MSDKTEPQVVILSPAEVLELIAPADPDTLQHIGNGVYEARWLKGSRPFEDIVTIRQNPRAMIVKEPFNLPLDSGAIARACHLSILAPKQLDPGKRNKS